jgi:hypothetical protein
LSKESNYNPDEIIKVKSLCRLHLQKEDLHLKPGHEAEVTKERASELECLGYVSVI